MNSSLTARLSILAALPLFLATVGCNGPTYGSSHPAAWVGSSADLATFDVAGTPPTIKPLNVLPNVSSMIFFQAKQDISVGDRILDILAGRTDCKCERLFYISGGKLNVVSQDVATTQSVCPTGVFTTCTVAPSNDTDAPRTATDVLKGQTIPIAGGASALYVASDGGSGTDVFFSASDGKIHRINGVSGNEVASLPVLAYPQNNNSSTACVTWQPHQLAIPYLSQSTDRGESGKYSLLGASADGKSTHVIFFAGFPDSFSSSFSEPSCKFYDYGDVGADASSIAADDTHTLVANPTQGTLYLFDVLGMQKAKTVNGAYAVAIADGTGWVTQNLQSTSGTPAATNVKSTGHTTGLGVDDYYSILADTTGQIKDLPEAGVVVTSQPASWVTVPGAGWIAPAADQSNATRNGKYLNTTTQYELEFDLADPAHTSLDFTISADDYVDVKFNGQSVFTHPNTSMSGSTYKFTISSGFLADNFLEFYVNNATGGPTGMILGVASSSTTTPATGNIVPVDLTSFTLGTPIPVGKCPTLIQAYHPDSYTDSDGSFNKADGPPGTLLYVSNTCDSTISVVDPVAKSVTQTIKLTAPANAIAVEP